MIGFRGNTAVLALTLLVTAGVGGVEAAHGSANVVLYASPTGSGDCSRAMPCDLASAVETAPPNSTLLLAAGDYYKASPTPAVLENDEPFVIKGPARGPRAVVYSAAHDGFFLFGADVSNVDIVSTGDGSAMLDTEGSVNHVHVTTSGEYACNQEFEIEDSVCVTTNPAGTAIEIDPEGGGNLLGGGTITGVTAEATGSDGVGIQIVAHAQTTLHFHAINDIFHGAAHDVLVVTSAPSATAAATLTVSHCDFVTSQAVSAGSAAPNSATIKSDGTNLTASPRYVHAALGDYHERRSSPTVDVGARVRHGHTDLVGVPRTVGGTPDIGAYEFLDRPVAHALKVVKKTVHTAKLTVRINPEGLPTKFVLVATQGKQHRRVKRSAGSGSKYRTFTLRLHGLRSHTRYRVRVTATNAGGHANAKPKHLTTKH